MNCKNCHNWYNTILIHDCQPKQLTLTPEGISAALESLLNEGQPTAHCDACGFAHTGRPHSRD